MSVRMRGFLTKDGEFIMSPTGDVIGESSANGTICAMHHCLFSVCAAKHANGDASSASYIEARLTDLDVAMWKCGMPTDHVEQLFREAGVDGLPIQISGAPGSVHVDICL